MCNKKNEELYKQIICQKRENIFNRWDDLKAFYRDCLEGKNLDDKYGERFNNWNSSFFGCDRQWVYRAQPSKHPLASTLERKIIQIDKCLMDKAQVYENLILKEFKRQLSNYIINTPKDDDTLDWFAIIRHYEGPSRLLDFTYSFYVASHFAFESTADVLEIWAIDSNWCTKKGAERLGLENDNVNIGKDGREFDKYLRPEKVSERKLVVYPVTPNHLNPRLAVQQGNFLCPGNVCRPFKDNLFGMCHDGISVPIVKLLIDKKCRNDGLRDLYYMNITYASLYPGLVGFAKSLEAKLLFPQLIGSNSL